jgi:hypothetical protein
MQQNNSIVKQPGKVQLKTAPQKTGNIGIEFKIAHTEEEIREALRLVYYTYKVSGFINCTKNEFANNKYRTNKSSVVLIGKQKNQIAMTISAYVDGAVGFPADEIFPTTMQNLRKNKRNIVEFGSLASVKTDKNSFIDFIDKTKQYAIDQKFDDIICLIHPRHMKIYEYLYGFKALTNPKPYKAVNNNPAVLALYKITS